MVTVMRKQRKSSILTPSKIPCLSKLPTINITQGCALGCTYCYIQGYANYPGHDRVILYENTAELLAAELSRKRKRPSRVYFSPSSDAFQHMPEVQDVTYKTMEVLLQAGVEVALLTKGFVTEPFFQLFSKTPELVFAQVGMTTLDHPLCKKIEPRTSTPQQRLDAIAALHGVGVRTTARLDPLIPDVTDTDENLIPLLDRIRKAGATHAAASYLFLRPGISRQMTIVLNNVCPAGAKRMIDTWPHEEFADGCGGGRMVDQDERARRFNRIQALGEASGIRVAVCRCKNPKIGGVGCEIMGPAIEPPSGPPEQGLLNFTDAAISGSTSGPKTPQEA